jgi:hypothetical protein
MNNIELIEAASLKTFHNAYGLPPADFVNQEMTARGGGFEPATLREAGMKILSAQSVNGLALVILLRQLNKDDVAQRGFVTAAYDLTGKRIYYTADHNDGKLPKSAKTGYREFGEVADELSHDTDLLANAIQRERDDAQQRADYLSKLLESVPAVAANDDTPAQPPVDPDAAVDLSEPDKVAEPVASRAQGGRRKA